MSETKSDNTVDTIRRLIRESQHDPEARAKVADALERMAIRELDKIADRYGATGEKDCACVTHEGPHWLWLQKLEARMNADLVRKGGQLTVYAYSQNEAVRQAELVAIMEKYERREKGK